MIRNFKAICHFLPLALHISVNRYGGAIVDKAVLGKRIREARIQKGLTQQALADKAGICVMYLGEIERGIKMPSMNSFIKIVEALDISADYVLRDEVSSGRDYVHDEIAGKLKNLTPRQRKTVSDISYPTGIRI